MINKIFDAIERFNMLSFGDSVAVGVSGGADSVCLLHFLTTFRDKYGIFVKAVHVNHQIRGSEAERDEQFVKSLCQKLGVELQIVQRDVPKLSKELSIGLEECGRMVRYEAFSNSGASKIAVAHTASDNAETVLFNLSRGTGLGGISGIKPVNSNVIRPLIMLSRAEVEEYCLKFSLPFVVDSTNSDDNYSRNNIRLNVVPNLKKVNSNFESNVLRFSLIARQEDDFLNRLCKSKIQEASISPNVLDAKKLLEIDKALIFRCIHIFLKEQGLSAGRKMVELCFNALKSGSRQQISKNVFFDAGGGILQIRDFSGQKGFEPFEQKAFLGENTYPFGTIVLQEVDVSCAEINEYNAFDPKNVDFQKLVLRNRRSGDTLTDGRRNVSKSLKKLFIEAKIPNEEKTKIPLLCVDNNIIWVKGFRIDKKFQISKSSQRAVIIRGL